MEKQLVTLAIHTYEKAQILKTLLEAEGIEAYIHNVNQIQPVISAGVRVRINEKDLPHALRIIEDTQWLSEAADEQGADENAPKKVLIPIDFSDYSIKACETGIRHAARIDAEVMLLHAYFSAYIPSALPFATSFNKRDIEAFGRFVTIFKQYPVQIELFNISTSRNEWNEIRLAGMDEYLTKQHPGLNIGHTVLRDGDLLDSIQTFVEEKRIDMIAFSTYRRSMITRIFNPSIARKMIFHGNTPLLVIPI